VIAATNKKFRVTSHAFVLIVNFFSGRYPASLAGYLHISPRDISTLMLFEAARADRPDWQRRARHD
jgi:hypothetical protein